MKEIVEKIDGLLYEHAKERGLTPEQLEAELVDKIKKYRLLSTMSYVEQMNEFKKDMGDLWGDLSKNPSLPELFKNWMEDEREKLGDKVYDELNVIFKGKVSKEDLFNFWFVGQLA